MSLLEVEIRLLEHGRAIALFTLNRPAVRNAFNTELARTLVGELAVLDSDPRVRALVLTGAGSIFCSGADLKERAGLDGEGWRHQHQIFEAMFEGLAHTAIPTIAAVEGYALAGGMELALNCDMIVADERAVFGLPEVTRGIMPGGGGTQLLARAAGPGRAKEIIMTGRRVSAQEALSYGLIQTVTAPGEALSQAVALASQIAANAPLSVRAIKRSIDGGSGQPLDRARQWELVCYDTLVDSQDRYEGIRAFNEKRPPHWQGK